ncbi:MAG: tetratricopeptide repeat protein [Lachnospiraceae bacterium]|nr:tetratricopeptide repeat protein [Lachnospiraceae bacterium]
MEEIIAKDYFVEDYIGDVEDVMRSIELLQMELENFVNQHVQEDLQEADAEVQNEAGYLLYTLGKSFYMIEDYAMAAEYFETGLAFNLDPNDQYVLEMVVAYGLALFNSGNGKEAIVLEAVYDMFDGQADFVFMMGLVYMEQKQYEQAIMEFAKASMLMEGAIAGSNSYLSQYYTGRIREEQGRIEEARAMYAKAVDYEPARERLASI